MIFPNGAAKSVEIEVKANKAGAMGVVAPQVPVGWHVEPASAGFSLSRTGEEATLRYTVAPAAREGTRRFAGAGQNAGWPNTDLSHGCD